MGGSFGRIAANEAHEKKPDRDGLSRPFWTRDRYAELGDTRTDRIRDRAKYGSDRWAYWHRPMGTGDLDTR